MKPLKDSILEKLKVDDIIINEKFPIDGDSDDITKFLKSEGFKEDVDANDNICECFNSDKCKCFTTFNDTFEDIVWFADTSKNKISKSNPIFYIDSLVNEFTIYYIDYKTNKTIYICENDKETFLKFLDKIFGFEY